MTKSKTPKFYKDFNVINGEDNSCFFCNETRQLQRAHIIPSSIFTGIEYEGHGVPMLNDCLLMCGIHHSCYDRFQLNEEEIAKLRPILEVYIDVFTRLLKCIYIEIPEGADKWERMKVSYLADRVTKSAWKWWRVYAIK